MIDPKVSILSIRPFPAQENGQAKAGERDVRTYSHSMDALSETLRAVRLSGAFFVDANFTAPWSYCSPRAQLLAPALEPKAERVVIFHLVTEGECFVELQGQPPLRLMAGDAVLFPHGDEHFMTSMPGLAPLEAEELAQLLHRRPHEIALGGGGAVTRFMCGYLACDVRLANLLLGGLPGIVRVNVRGSDAGTWLEASLRYALAETKQARPGGVSVLSKLAEVLFIEMLRLYMATQGPRAQGWLAGLRDRIVGAALNAIHAQPAADWTIDALAKEAGSSRSVLAERFQQLVGMPPMQYLTRWRMLLAANLLCSNGSTLLQVAQEVGYQTDTAFSRAFRREYGMPPAAWRRGQVKVREEAREEGAPA